MTMPSTITLQTEQACDIVLPLGDQYVAFNGSNSVDIVYQDATYEYILDLDESLALIQDIEIFVGNRQIPIEYSYEVASHTFRAKAKNKGDLKPFFLLYGIAEITVRLTYRDTRERYLFSSHLAVAINRQYEEVMESVKDMLDDIYKKDHSLLYRGKPDNKMESSLLFRKQDNKFEEEITTIKTIINVLKKNLPYFMKSPKTTTLPAFHVDNIEKLHTIGSKNLNYIATHPEQLRQSTGATGIFLNKRQMIPEKTLVSMQSFSCETVENRAILSFIHTLSNHVNERKNEIARAVSESIYAIKQNEDVQETYILSTTIIQQYTMITLSEYLSAIEILSDQCNTILVQYKKALPCSFSALRYIPPPTPIFLEVYHYRNVYEMINLWFSYGKFSIPSEKIKLHLSSADTIYEYFSLLNLYDAIVSLGYTEVAEKRTRYKYTLDDPRFIQTGEENTYYFQNGESEITLFYQPIIYSENSTSTNGITLFRTDGNFYSPDFVIKKQSSDGISYGILDAKWRTRAVLKDRENSGSLPDLVYKYFYSIVDANTLQHASFFWLLQGKDDRVYKPTYFHNRGNISKTKNIQFQYATGIVQLTPKSGTTELTHALRTFLLS